MEFLLQLMAELFTGEPIADEIEKVTEINPNEVMEAASTQDVEINPTPETILVEEPILFNVVQFH